MLMWKSPCRIFSYLSQISIPGERMYIDWVGDQPELLLFEH